MSERRFSEEEVAEILKYAAEAEDSSGSLVRGGSGLTLTELNEIGREVGISPESIQQAVQRVVTPDAPARRFLGLPLGVARTIDLDRKLTDDEWDRLVVKLRETFNARGVVKQEGSLRSWSNGNLQVLLEPTPGGQRLRLRTVKGNAMQMMAGGIGIFTMSVVMFIAAALGNSMGDAGMISSISFLGVGGAGMFAAGASGLPGWARVRQRQMNEIAEHAANVSRTPALKP